jgi:hypothetical protein
MKKFQGNSFRENRTFFPQKKSGGKNPNPGILQQGGETAEVKGQESIQQENIR